MATKRVTVTIPEELLSSIRERIGARGLSAYVTDALVHRERIDLVVTPMPVVEARGSAAPSRLPRPVAA